MPNFIQVTPFLHVPDINAAVQWFHDTLGFELLLRQSDYAYMEREGVGFRLLQQSGENIMDGNRHFAYYIDVRDLDALYAELKPKLDQMPPRDVYGPVNQPYGQRELLVLAPDGNLIAFGQAIEGNRQ
jgi:catechol 2,3-dioxygenase-like lactoylglutathione lyase family enzyme